MKKLLVLFLIACLFSLSSCNFTIEKTDPTPVSGEVQKSETEALPESQPETKQQPKPEAEQQPNPKPEQPEHEPEQQSEPEAESKPQPSTGLDRTKTGFGYVPNAENKQVSIGQKYEDMMTRNGAFFIDRANTKNIYLTMDEGYENGYTSQILDTLKEKGIQCAFFVTQPYVDKNPDLIKRMIAEGHIVGNHSVNHKSMPTLTDEEVKNEIMGLHNDVLSKFGYKMTYFRPPMGEYSESSLSVTNSLGYRSVFWSFAYRDWETDNVRGKDYAIESVNNGIHNGCVLLLHAVSKDNADGLGEIIDSLREKGYVFSSLDNIR